MTPKEKAEELFEKFNNPDTTHYPYVHNAQQCALIAVDEILQALPPFEYGLEFVAKIDFWEEVKKEIEKI